jgi:hypothetical protein
VIANLSEVKALAGSEDGVQAAGVTSSERRGL